MTALTLDASGIVQVVVAIGGVIVLIMNTWATMETKKTVAVIKEDAAKTAVEQGEQLSVIHDNGNAHLALMTEKLSESEKRNEMLAAESAKRQERASQDAISRIEKLELLLTMSRQNVAPPPAPPAPPVPLAIAPNEGAEQRTVRVEEAAAQIVKVVNDVPRLLDIQGDVKETRVIVEDTQEILSGPKAVEP